MVKVGKSEGLSGQDEYTKVIKSEELQLKITMNLVINST